MRRNTVKNTEDFNRDRERQEKEFGKDIDEGKFSAPGRELAPDIAGRGLTAALNKSLSLNKPNRPDLRRNAIRLPAEIADTSSIVNFIRLRD